jgi:uncharacterized lipoprotein
MATFYNRVVQNVDTSEVVAVTSSSDSTIILSILVANTNGASTSDVTVRQNAAGGALDSYLAFTVPVPADANLDVLSNKYILPSGKSLGVLSSSSGTLDVIVSYVEV